MKLNWEEINNKNNLNICICTIMQKLRLIQRGEHENKGFGVLTSGSAVQGMNAAITAVVRMTIYLGCKVFLIKEGYMGMVNGGNDIVEADWYSVANIIHQGGTIIDSVKCIAFKTREGRLKAAYNLVINQITNLIVIGGEGSLTAAETLRLEWDGLLNELLGMGKINAEQKRKNYVLHIVGILGTAVNDFVGTERTIGTDSALHRIIESIEFVSNSRYSHLKTLIIQLMGRDCGYLAISAALASEADFIFIPEDPAEIDWPELLRRRLIEGRNAGQRLSIVIITEFSIDRNGQIIKAEDVKAAVDELDLNAEITQLGHFQHGGKPSAFDRVLACRMGVEAVLALMEFTESSIPCVVTLDGNQTVRVPLIQCIMREKAILQAMEDKNWEMAVKLRGQAFEKNLLLYKRFSQLEAPENSLKKSQASFNYKIAMIHIGGPVTGMNVAVRSIVRHCIYRGAIPLGIEDGIEGLIAGKIKEMKWSDVVGWLRQGRCNLGSRRSLPEGKFTEIAARFKEFEIQGVIFIGGFDAYLSCGQLLDKRSDFREFCIPMVVLPTTLTNNVPGTDFTLGCDTALNEITEICDNILLSAHVKRRVYVVETMGGYCGYLATLSAIASGADAAYIFEEKFNLNDLSKDVHHMISKMEEGIQYGLIIRNEKASVNYDTNLIYRVFSEEGMGRFTCRMVVLGHMQQGRSCSPFDRTLGTKMGEKCVKWVIRQLKKNQRPDKTISPHYNSESACVLGLVCRRYLFTPLHKLICETNFNKRLSRKQWWLKLRPLLRILSNHASAFEEESVYVKTDQECESDDLDTDEEP